MTFLLALLLSPVLLVCSLVLRVLYRLTVHPLAKVSGPRRAAATSLYAAYYDIVSKDSLVKRLQSLHERYGPFRSSSSKQCLTN
jgi:hypothetical protein